MKMAIGLGPALPSQGSFFVVSVCVTIIWYDLVIAYQSKENVKGIRLRTFRLSSKARKSRGQNSGIRQVPANHYPLNGSAWVHNCLVFP